MSVARGRTRWALAALPLLGPLACTPEDDGTFPPILLVPTAEYSAQGLGRIVDVAADENGRLAVLGGTGRDVLVFDADGRIERALTLDEVVGHGDAERLDWFDGRLVVGSATGLTLLHGGGRRHVDVDFGPSGEPSFWASTDGIVVLTPSKSVAPRPGRDARAFVHLGLDPGSTAREVWNVRWRASENRGVRVLDFELPDRVLMTGGADHASIFAREAGRTMRTWDVPPGVLDRDSLTLAPRPGGVDEAGRLWLLVDAGLLVFPVEPGSPPTRALAPLDIEGVVVRGRSIYAFGSSETGPTVMRFGEPSPPES